MYHECNSLTNRHKLFYKPIIILAEIKSVLLLHNWNILCFVFSWPHFQLLINVTPLTSTENTMLVKKSFDEFNLSRLQQSRHLSALYS